MPSQHNHGPLLNQRAAAASVALPRQEAASHLPLPLWVAITKLVICEFFVVAGAAYLASVIYHEAVMREWSSPLYIVANLVLAATVESIALGFCHSRTASRSLCTGFFS